MKRIISSVLSLCLLTCTPLWAQQDRIQRPAALSEDSLQISPEAVGALVLGQKIQLMMRDGTYVEGKVVRSDLDRISMHVEKSEPRGRIREPEADLSTLDIAVIHLRKNGTATLPIVLGIAGGFGGWAGAAVGAQYIPSLAGAIGVCMVGAVGGATGGALLGRKAARKTVTINIVPRAGSPDKVAGLPEAETNRFF